MEILLNKQFLAAMKDLKTQDSELLTTIGLSDLLGDVMYFEKLPSKRFTLSQEERDRLANDRRWATDPLELMDKFEWLMDSIGKFLDVLSA